MKKTTLARLLSLLVLLALAGSACVKKEGPAERAGKKVDKALEKIGDKIEDAGDKIEDAADKAEDKIEDALDDDDDNTKPESKP